MALQGFVESDYLDAKLAALVADTSQTTWTSSSTTAELLTALVAAGFTAESHYTQHGFTEGLGPNTYFDPAQYAEAKAQALLTAGTYSTIAEARTAVDAYFVTNNSYQHYLDYGASEGLNPSNTFDESSYLTDKLAALVADTTQTTWTSSSTVAEFQTALADAGYTALTHYLAYGAAESLSVTAVPTSEQVTVPSANPGETFTLTTDADTVFGTTGDDTFNATSTTYNSTDAVADATSSDNDTIAVEATDDISATPTVIGVENLTFNLTATTTTGTASNFDVAIDNVNAANVTLSNSSSSSPVTGASITGVATGSTINTSDHFDTVVVDADDNAAVTINVGTTTSANTNLTIQDASGEVDAATVVAAGALTLAGSTNDGVLTLTSAGNMVATATAATTVTATSGGTTSLTTAAATSITATSTGQLTLVDGDLATTLSLTSLDDVDITTADVATTATISAGTVTTDAVSTITGAALLTSLNVSGNGSAATISTVGADLLASVAVSGDQDVTIAMDASDIDALTAGTGDVITVTDTSTAGTTTLQLGTAAGNVNATAADVDVIDLAIDNDGKTLTVATGATVQVSVDQNEATSASTITAASSTASTNAVTLDIDDGTTAVTAIDLDGLTLSNFATVAMTLSNNTTMQGDVSFGIADVTVTGAGTLTSVESITAGSIDASGLSAVVNVEIEGGTTLDDLTTGSANDVLTATTAASTGGYTISTGAGADLVDFSTAAATVADGDLTFDGGSGVDTLKFAAATDISQETISLTSVEVIDYRSVLTVDSSMVSGKTYLFTSNGADTDDVLTIAMDAATVDLSSLSFTYAQDTTAVNGSAIGAFNNLSITGSSLVDAIVGGAGDDTVVATGTVGDAYTTGGGADTYTGGAGVDAIIISGANGSSLNLTGGLTGTDTITNAANNVIHTTTMADATDVTYTGGTAADTFVSGGGAITFTGAAGADVYTCGSGVDTIVLNNVANVKSTADTITGFTSADSIDIEATASGQFGDLHLGTGVAFDGAKTGDVLTYNVAAVGAAMGATDNVIEINADTSDLSIGYASSTALLTALDGDDLVENGGTTDLSAADEILVTWFNSANDEYEVGIITVVGADGLAGGDDTYESLLQIDTTGVTLAQVSAAIDFIA